MTLALISQRVDITPHGERRDGLDQRWHLFLAACGVTALAVPNVPSLALSLFNQHTPSLLILSGGNDLAAYGGNAPERDETERQLLQKAIEARMPVLGVCRGMQVIGQFFGAELRKCEGHVAVRHDVSLAQGTRQSVNSYHNWCLQAVKPPLYITAQADDGTVEALCHESLPLQAIMWHPERESMPAPADIALVQAIMRGQPCRL